jgi:hypothetical protein
LKRLYTASGLPEAYLLRDYLDAQGVQTVVFNEHSAGAMGELPCNEVLPELWIRDERHFEHARTLLLGFESAVDASVTRTCPRCSEDNPSTFDLCWQCGNALKS